MFVFARSRQVIQNTSGSSRERRSAGAELFSSLTRAGPKFAEELVSLRAWRKQLLSPVVIADTFNMQTPGDKERLALQVWKAWR